MKASGFRVLTVGLASAALFSLCACGSDTAGAENSVAATGGAGAGGSAGAPAVDAGGAGGAAGGASGMGGSVVGGGGTGGTGGSAGGGGGVSDGGFSTDATVPDSQTTPDAKVPADAASCTGCTPSAFEADPTGWEDLFPKPGFANWTRVPASIGTVWALSADGGTLICNGVGANEVFLNGAVRGNGIFHVEWRWGTAQTPPAGPYNGGVLVRASADGVTWVQAQVARAPQTSVVGDLIVVMPADAGTTRIDVPQTGANREALLGQWNTYEVTAQGAKISEWVNGATTATYDGVPMATGRVGLQAEGALYEVRSIKYKPLN
jgi:hypothetical protein